MTHKLHIVFGWLYFCAYTFRIIPMNDGSFTSIRIYFFKVGTTPKEKEVLERGI